MAVIAECKGKRPGAFGRFRTALVTLVGATLIQIGGAAAETVEFWSPFTGPDGAAIDALVRQFNETTGKENDVEVELLIIPWDQYYTKLSVALASRTAPGLAVMHSHQIPGFVKQGALEAFSDAEIAGAGLEEADYIPQLWDAGEVDGERYGIAIDAFPRHIYYNKKLFEQAGLDPDKAPATGAEVTEAARKIAALGDDVYGFFFNLTGSGVARNFYSVYWQYQDDLYNADRTDVAPGFEESAKKALSQFKAFLDEGLSPTQDIEDDAKLFAQDKIGISLTQITDLAVYQAAAENQGLEFGVGPMPQFGDQPATFALGHNFVIPRGGSGEGREAAMVFIKWIGDNGVAWAATGKVPAKTTVIASEEFKALPEQNTVAEALDIVRFPPPIAVQPAVDRVVQDTIEAFYAGRMDIDQTVAMLADGIRAELAKQ